MATYRVYQKGQNAKGNAPIYISFYLNREKIEIPAKISIPTKYFDPVKGLVKSSYEFAKDKNLIISDIKAKINDILVRYRLSKKELNRNTFFKEFSNPEQSQDFFAFCTEYQKLRFQEIQVSTQDKHKSCLSNLREFKSEITFAELDEEFLRKFILYLRKKKGLKEITINKNISVIKSYLAAARKKGIISDNPTKDLKLCQCEDTTAPCITEDELMKLVELYKNHFFVRITHDALEFFLFMCFSSLHITDARNLRIEQIGENDLNALKDIMGHTNIKQTLVYAHVLDQDKQDGVSAFNSFQL